MNLATSRDQNLNTPIAAATRNGVARCRTDISVVVVDLHVTTDSR